MSLLKTETPDVMRPAAGFHRNDAGRQRSKKVQQPVSLEPFTKHNRSRFIQPGKTANGLAQINAQNLDVHLMLLSPPMPATIAAFGGKAVHPISSQFTGPGRSPNSLQLLERPL
mgnify:CR=1 FL=1